MSRQRLVSGIIRGRLARQFAWPAVWMLFAGLMLAAWPVSAALAQGPTSESKPFAEHFLLLQLSDADPDKQAMVLSAANNLLEHYGPDHIDIEVVTFGPGVRLLFADAPQLAQVNSLVAQGVRFVVCLNTVDTIERNSGQRPPLNPHAIPVQVGLAHVLDRVEAGFVLVRP